MKTQSKNVYFLSVDWKNPCSTQKVKRRPWEEMGLNLWSQVFKKNHKKMTYRQLVPELSILLYISNLPFLCFQIKFVYHENIPIATNKSFIFLNDKNKWLTQIFMWKKIEIKIAVVQISSSSIYTEWQNEYFFNDVSFPNWKRVCKRRDDLLPPHGLHLVWHALDSICFATCRDVVRDINSN